MNRKIAGLLITMAALAGVVAAAVIWNRSRDRSPDPPSGEVGWDPAAPLPGPRVEAAGTTLDGKLVVIGGFVDSALTTTTRVDLFDPATGEWTRLSDVPSPVTHADAVADGTRLWLAGGFVGDSPGAATSEVWAYDLPADRWTPGPPLPEARGSGALVLNGRTLHYFGGFLADRDTNAPDHWLLDADAPSAWEPAAPLPAARGQHGAVSIDGRVYAVGGQFFHDSQPPVDLDLVHVYDPAVDEWRRLRGLPIPVSHAEASTFAYRDRIYVVGGRTAPPLRSLDEVFMYEPGIDEWIGLPPLPNSLLGAVSNVIDGELLVAGGSVRRAIAPVSDTWRRRLHDVWSSGPAAPIELGDVAGGIVGDKVYLVGGRAPPFTLAYDLARREWTSPGALTRRPFAGDYHAAEVWDGKLYLIGGLGRATGRTQVYDPITDSWTIGRDMPFPAGSSASAVIDGKIYVAGGIVGGHTTDRAAVYDPARDEWTEIAPMPAGRNHAASATDGRLFYVFGGRGHGSGDGDVVANGFADTQVYDPETKTWDSSAHPGSLLRPLPQARGAMGKAVYARGRFYVFGGETGDGPGANDRGVYDRVDIYDPRSHRWEQGAPMPTARQGIFPLGIADRVYVAAGGSRAGGGWSRVLEVYDLP